MRSRRCRRPRGILLWRARPRPPDIASRLRLLLARVREMRGNLYPDDWDADPWHLIEQDIASLLQDLTD